MAAWAGAVTPACGQLRIVNYNVNASDTSLTSPRAGMDAILAAINASAKGGFARPIDILVLEEANTVSTTGTQFAGLLNTLTGGTSYARSQLNGDTSGSGRPICIYNTATVRLTGERTIGVVSSTGQPRQTLRYQFEPVGYDAAAAFTLYASHYKASNTSSDEARRNVEAVAIRADADALGAGTAVIHLGDLNFYKATDPAFVTLTGTGPAQFVDPVGSVGSWSGNAAFTAVHTQSPATTAFFGGQVTGGLDDRFDFQLTTGALLDGRGMDCLTNSYWAFGNTNTHTMKGAVTTGSAASLAALLPGYTTAQAASVLTSLSQVTDHLPVVADYQLPARLSAGLAGAPTTVIRGGSATVSLSVSNSAPVGVVRGADRLDYTYAGTGICAGSGTGSDQALGGGNVHELSLSTAAIGAVTGTVTVQATSPQAANASFAQAVTLSVLEHATGSFVSGSTATTLDIDFGTLTQGTGTASRSGGVFNRAGGLGDGWTARLDLDVVTPAVPGGIFSTTLAPFLGLASGSSRAFGVSMLSTTTGSFSGSYTLSLSDQDLPGATTRTMTMSLRGTVVSPATAVLSVTSGSQTQLALGFAGISGTAAVTKTGSGTAVLSDANSYTGRTSVSQGTLTLTGTRSLGGSRDVSIAAAATLDARQLAGGYVIGSGTVLSGSGGLRGALTLAGGTLALSSLVVDGSTGLTSLTVATGVVAGLPRLSVLSGGTVVLPQAVQAAVAVRGLQVTGGGRIDIGVGQLAISSGGIATDDLVTALVAGRNGGGWDGPGGITSGLVATQVAAGMARSLGWSEQGDGSLLVRYAAPGDTDLDGLVDVLDVANVLGSGKLNSGLPTTWSEGDFNYDGLLDILDMADFMSSGLLNAGGYNDAPIGLVAVPEPAVTGVALVLLVCAGLRRQGLHRAASPGPRPAGRQQPRRRRVAMTATAVAAMPRAAGSGTTAMLAAGGPL
ncbi:MAG: autotransporter-associated beta strand repeat-containing protein [Planctomycetaceae bacterium]